MEPNLNLLEQFHHDPEDDEYDSDYYEPGWPEGVQLGNWCVDHDDDDDNLGSCCASAWAYKSATRSSKERRYGEAQRAPGGVRRRSGRRTPRWTSTRSTRRDLRHSFEGGVSTRGA